MSISDTEVQVINRLVSLKGQPAFLRDWFFGRRDGARSQKIAIIRNTVGNTVAPFVEYSIHAKKVVRDNVTVQEVEPELLAPEMEYDPRSVLFAPQGLIGGRSNNDYATEIRARNALDLERMITRREELMIGELLTTGKISISGEGKRGELDLWNNIADKPFVNVGAADSDLYWGGTKADIIGDIESAIDAMQTKGGVTPTGLVLGTAAYKAFMASDKVQKLLDNRRIDLGEIRPRNVPGARFIGNFLGLDLWSYSHVVRYQTTAAAETWTTKNVLPSNMALFCSPDAGAHIIDGALPDIETGTGISRTLSARPRHYDEYARNAAAPTLMQRLRAAPMPVVENLHGFRTLQVLAS